MNWQNRLGMLLEEIAARQVVEMMQPTKAKTRHPAVRQKGRGRDSLTAYLVPIPECGNLSDYSRLGPIVNGRLAIEALSWVRSNATKPPQTLRARATQRFDGAASC